MGRISRHSDRGEDSILVCALATVLLVTSSIIGVWTYTRGYARDDDFNENDEYRYGADDIVVVDGVVQGSLEDFLLEENEKEKEKKREEKEREREEMERERVRAEERAKQGLNRFVPLEGTDPTTLVDGDIGVPLHFAHGRDGEGAVGTISPTFVHGMSAPVAPQTRYGHMMLFSTHKT